ncbi:pimeloyl-CoA dehydrogenase small subunit [Brevundimonas sp. S30B]|uniref:acyl-CoA dehydrogenase family protein n=1 Tax=unclassified Brevundimonas TaxID=2622653 RepID=UPI00107251BA|nr:MULTISPECIES: acyl-CoA dehydrogenase [unclassified Brevundimonas]QBX36667.1 pimeloyl-CoA dehydrogenase small subunit [Brevundimonas sp. MF30-B]TFW04538.1 pimeloyl-CoA dehydrogenase small subunit [Brevundimonas sp. S30B]
MRHDEPTHEFRTQLRESLSRLMQRQYDFESRQRFRREAPGYSTEAWAAYAELGLLALGVSEEGGGLGGGLGDLGAALDVLGGALALEPLLPSVVFGARLIDRFGSPQQKALWAPGLLSGACIASLAHIESEGRYGLGVRATTARRDGAHWVLDGSKQAVEGGGAAGLLVVSARMDGGGTGLFLVEADAPGVTRTAGQAFDGLGLSEVGLDSVRLDPDALLGGMTDAAAVLDRAVDEAAALQCADAVGAMRAANALTLDYVRTRKQFGGPIGGFQALQHRLVDMKIAEALAEAITQVALNALDAEATDSGWRVSAAKVRCGQSARLIAQETVQMHGGMGLAEEYPAAHFFARLGLFERRWGDGDHHLLRYAEATGADVKAT